MAGKKLFRVRVVVIFPTAKCVVDAERPLFPGVLWQTVHLLLIVKIEATALRAGKGIVLEDCLVNFTVASVEWAPSGRRSGRCEREN